MTGDFYCPPCARAINEQNPMWKGARLIAFPTSRDPMVFLVHNVALVRSELKLVIASTLGPTCKIIDAADSDSHYFQGAEPDLVVCNWLTETVPFQPRMGRNKQTLVLVRGGAKFSHMASQKTTVLGIGEGYSELKTALVEQMFKEVTEGL